MTKQKIIRFIFELRNEQYAFWRLMVLSSLVGLVAGLGAMLFHGLLAGCESLFLHRFGGWDPAGPDGAAPLLTRALQGRDWRIVLAALAPFLGGLISGLIVWRFAPEAEGHGTDNAIEAFHHRGGRVRARVPFVKTLTSALTIGSGGSGGQEGPIAQIGSGFGALFATWLRLSTRERRILMAAGMAGGIGSIFRAPIAGALFAAEVLYRDMDMEYEVLIPSIFSSVVAYAVFASRFGWQPLFAVPDFVFNCPVQLLA